MIFTVTEAEKSLPYRLLDKGSSSCSCPYKTSGDERSVDERSGDERSVDERSGDERSGDERSGDERS
jgi:hypothetical protein